MVISEPQHAFSRPAALPSSDAISKRIASASKYRLPSWDLLAVMGQHKAFLPLILWRAYRAVNISLRFKSGFDVYLKILFSLVIWLPWKLMVDMLLPRRISRFIFWASTLRATMHFDRPWCIDVSWFAEISAYDIGKIIAYAVAVICRKWPVFQVMDILPSFPYMSHKSILQWMFVDATARRDFYALSISPMIASSFLISFE